MHAARILSRQNAGSREVLIGSEWFADSRGALRGASTQAAHESAVVGEVMNDVLFQRQR
jgi:hypothetical protein